MTGLAISSVALVLVVFTSFIYKYDLKIWYYELKVFAWIVQRYLIHMVMAQLLLVFEKFKNSILWIEDEHELTDCFLLNFQTRE